MFKVKEFIKRINIFSKLKAFLAANPQRAKLIGIIIIIAIVPLTIAAALTVQNLSQKASQNGGLEIVDKNGNVITETYDPVVYLRITLPNNWVLPPSSQSYNGFVKSAYAVNIDIEDTGGTLPTSTPMPTPISACITTYKGQCISENVECSSLGNYVRKSTYVFDCPDATLRQCCVVPAADPTTTSAVSPTVIPTSVTIQMPEGNQCLDDCISMGRTQDRCMKECKVPTPTLAVYVLKDLYFQGDIWNEAYMGANIWSQQLISIGLLPLQPSENSALRKITVTLIAVDGFRATLPTATVTLKRSPGNPPVSFTVSITPPVSYTVSPTCKIGVNSFGVNDQCSIGGYRSMHYQCFNGGGDSISYAQESPANCKSSEVWRAEAEFACKGSSSCNVVTPVVTPRSRYDLNGDGKVSMDDINIFMNYYYGRKGSNLPGDFDGDGIIGAIDYNILLKAVTE